MRPEEARSYMERWTRVGELEIEESRRTPVEVKLRQLDTLMRSVDAMGWRQELREGEEEVWAVWDRLRAALGA